MDEWARAQPHTMLQTFDHIDEEYGSLENYLDHIGFDCVWRSRLRDAMLNPSEMRLRGNLSAADKQRGTSATQQPPAEPLAADTKPTTLEFIPGRSTPSDGPPSVQATGSDAATLSSSMTTTSDGDSRTALSRSQSIARVSWV